MRRPLSVSLFIALFGCGPSFAESGHGSTVTESAKMQPRGAGVGDGLKTGKAAANLAHSGALFLTEFANRYRLDRAAKAALQSQLPEITAALRTSGATGMLLEGRFAASTAALRCGDECGPPNMTQRLLGDRLNVLGQGRKICSRSMIASRKLSTRQAELMRTQTGLL
jgi:hypothetical protein